VSNILITGGSGLIGSRLTELLLQRGHRVSHLGRTKHDTGIHSYTWNVEQHQIDPEALLGIDSLIHLAGAGIADKPWTSARKREILESRTNATRLLYDELKKGRHTVKAFISASAIGYYGFNDNEEICTEESNAGNDFLATVTRRWENEIDAITTLGIRVVKVRIGIVLSDKGGALKGIMRPVKLLAGAPLGSGNQYMSWIHLDDLCGIFIKAIEDQAMHGLYNGVSPTPVTNRDLTVSIAKMLRKPLILPAVPSFLLKLLLGEMADLVLRGSKVSAQKILQAGYSFKFQNINDALRDLLIKK
jgi:uncharacterized protein